MTKMETPTGWRQNREGDTPCANSANSAISFDGVAAGLDGGASIIPDTTSARALIKALSATAMATLATRANAARTPAPDLSAAVDPRAIVEAEAAAARLLNAAASAALALLSTRTPTAATLDMIRTVAKLTAALAGPSLLASNDSVEKV